MSGLSSRSIEKIESGKHRCQMQSLEMISKAVGINTDFFRKPSAEEKAILKAETERALSKTILIPTHPIRSANSFLSIFGDWHARRYDASQIENDDASDIVAGLNDYIEDIGCIWEDCSEAERLQYARVVFDMCVDLKNCGYVCYIGSHQQRMKLKDKPDLIFKVGVLAFLPLKDNDDEHYVAINLEPGWVRMEA